MAQMSVRMEWRGDEIKGLVRDATVRGLKDGVEVAKEASVKLAPLLTGELRASAYTDVDPVSLIGIVGYDVPRDIKAIKQHEDLSYRHPAGETAKFLETPVKESQAQAQAKLAMQLRRVLGG